MLESTARLLSACAAHVILEPSYKAGENQMSETNGQGPISQRAVEDRIKAIEKETGWHVSLPGKIVIQQFFVALSSDLRIGLIQVERREHRLHAMRVAFDALDGFLKDLIVTSSKAREPASDDEKEIGAVIIIQNVNNLAQQKKCSFWPR
jgi:hypothetical protein